MTRQLELRREETKRLHSYVDVQLKPEIQCAPDIWLKLRPENATS